MLRLHGAGTEVLLFAKLQSSGYMWGKQELLQKTPASSSALSVKLQCCQQEKKVKGSHRLWENHTRPSLLRTVPTSWRYWASG